MYYTKTKHKYPVRLIISVFFAVLVLKSNAQQESVNNEKRTYVFFEANYGISKLMTGYTSLYPVASHFFELRIAKQSNGYRDWQINYGYPEIGLSILYGNLGDENVFGQTWGIVPNLTLNAWSDKPLSIKVKFGIGLGYFTRIYDEIENPENTYIGSKITNFSQASFTVQQKIRKNTYIQYGINYYHCSNGHYQVPNVGMNLPGFMVGVKHYPMGKFHLVKDKVSYNEGNPKWKLSMRCGMGVHEFAGTLGPVGGPKFRINTFDLYLTKPVGKVVNITTGMAIKYYTDYYEFAVKNDFFNVNQKWNASVISIFIGNEFLLYKTGVFIQTGFDIHAPFEFEYMKYKKRTLDYKNYIENFVSSKVGINYYVFDPQGKKLTIPYIGIFLKTNFGMADFVGTHIGILINRH